MQSLSALTKEKRYSIKYYLPYGIDGGPDGNVGRAKLEHKHVSLEAGKHVSESFAVEYEKGKKDCIV